MCDRYRRHACHDLFPHDIERWKGSAYRVPAALEERNRLFGFGANILGAKFNISFDASEGLQESISISPTAGLLIASVIIGGILVLTQF